MEALWLWYPFFHGLSVDHMKIIFCPLLLLFMVNYIFLVRDLFSHDIKNTKRNTFMHWRENKSLSYVYLNIENILLITNPLFTDWNK